MLSATSAAGVFAIAHQNRPRAGSRERADDDPFDRRRARYEASRDAIKDNAATELSTSDSVSTTLASESSIQPHGQNTQRQLFDPALERGLSLLQQSPANMRSQSSVCAPGSGAIRDPGGDGHRSRVNSERLRQTVKDYRSRASSKAFSRHSSQRETLSQRKSQLSDIVRSNLEDPSSVRASHDMPRSSTLPEITGQQEIDQTQASTLEVQLSRPPPLSEPTQTMESLGGNHSTYRDDLRQRLFNQSTLSLQSRRFISSQQITHAGELRQDHQHHQLCRLRCL